MSGRSMPGPSSPRTPPPPPPPPQPPEEYEELAHKVEQEMTRSVMNVNLSEGVGQRAQALPDLSFSASPFV